MALFCFLTRRACSRYAVLGEPLLQGSKLEAHVAGCRECREYWDDLRLLTTDLDRLVHVPRPSPQFAEPIWERVKPTVRTVQWGRMSLAGAVACGLACGLIWWRLSASSSHKPSVEVAASDFIKSAPEEEPVLAPAPAAPVVKRPHIGAAVAAKAATPRRYRLRWEPVHGGSRNSRMARRTRHGAPDLSALAGIDGPDRMRASGLMHEAQGDPGLANVAYQAAYQQQPSEETAFDVGRTAEESGDMEQAMNIYARLLESADSRSRSQKGWNP